jgi:5'-3' exonuclease
VKIHLVDGTYELFRAFYSSPRRPGSDGREVGAVRGLVRSLLALLAERNVTHVAVAFDHVIESFRNERYPGYKTGEGVEADLLAQFELAETATRALGIVTWPMVEFEADDALASAVVRFADAPGVAQVVLCSPDKDLAQCIRGDRVVALDRMRRRVLDEPGVIEKFGVPPRSIPDWLALVGDAADGFPGIPRWGAKSAAAVLSVYGSIDAIPDDAATWTPKVRGAETLAANLRSMRAEAALFRELATLRTDVPLTESVDDLRWRGPDAALDALCEILDDAYPQDRALQLAATKSASAA